MTSNGHDRQPAALNTQPNLRNPDELYQELVDMHRGLSEPQSALVNTKLILLLSNHIGDPQVLREAMRAARQDVAPEPGARFERP